MKGFILSLLTVFTTNVFATGMHPASDFVNDTLTRGKQILENKSEEYRRTNICQLLKNRVHSSYIASVWLGDYRGLKRDQAGIKSFTGLIPSILVTKAVQAIGGGNKRAGFAVSPEASDRGNGYFDVAVTLQTRDGSHNGNAIVLQTKKGFMFVDVEYMGFSAVNYAAEEYQNILNEEYQRDPNRSLPVTAMVNRVAAQDGFIRCP